MLVEGEALFLTDDVEWRVVMMDWIFSSGKQHRERRCLCTIGPAIHQIGGSSRLPCALIV